MQFKGFPDKPFSIEGSFVFLRNVKYNNIEGVKKSIEIQRELIYEYN